VQLLREGLTHQGAFMNDKLRNRIKAVIKSMKAHEALDEKAVRALRFELGRVKAESSADVTLAKEFYGIVRKQENFRQSIDEKELPKVVSREELSDDDCEGTEIIYKSLSDSYKSLASYTTKEKLKLWHEQFLTLEELLHPDVTIAAHSNTHYFMQANKIVTAHRYLMRLLGVLPWADVHDREEFAKPLSEIYNRLEDYGWQCAAGKANGLAPLKTTATKYDEIDYVKKSQRFFQTLKASNKQVPYAIPLVSVKKCLAKLPKLEIHENQIRMHQDVSAELPVSPALNAVAMPFLHPLHSSARVATRLSSMKPISAQSRVAPSSSSLSTTIAVKKPAMKRAAAQSASNSISDEKNVADSLLQLFEAAGEKRKERDKEEQKSAKKVRFNIPVTAPSAVQNSLFSHRRSMLRRSSVIPTTSMSMECGDSPKNIRK
jgi:hypothetical protein